MIKWWTEIFSSINNLKYYYMYIYAYLKNVKMNMGINFWKKIPHIHVCIMNHWDVYTLLYRGLGEGKWMCISSSACMHVYQCNYPAHHSNSTLLLENKPFVGIVTQRVLCSIRRTIEHVINSNTVISHANTRLEVNSIRENYKLSSTYCIYKE